MRWLVALLLLSGVALAQSQEPPKTPEIKSEQQPESGLNAKQQDAKEQAAAEKPPTVVQSVSHETGERESRRNAEQRADEGTEFWPPLNGYRLKVTDTLLVLFTFLLFWATVGLYCSTRRLVKDAQRQFVRTERPYLFLFDVMLPPRKLWHEDGPTNILFYDVANFGKTPAAIHKVETGIGLGDAVPILKPVDSDHRLVTSDSMSPTKQQDKIRHAMPNGVLVRAAGKTAGLILDNEPLLFRVRIFYSGPFSAGHETAGLWRYDIPGRSFVRHGGSEYNYTR